MAADKTLSDSARAVLDAVLPGVAITAPTNKQILRRDPGGTTYIVGTWPEDAPHVAVVGDALFAGSIGRGNQSWDLARQKVCDQILTLPPETLLCPGHGPLTTVAEEKAHNPFF